MKRFSLTTAIAAIALLVQAQAVVPDTVAPGEMPPPPPEQNDQQHQRPHRPRHPRFTVEQMTNTMVEVLGLNEKQAKNVAKLNEKYSTLIEGPKPDKAKAKDGDNKRPDMPQGGRPGGGMGGHGGPGGGMGGPGGGGPGMGGPGMGGPGGQGGPGMGGPGMGMMPRSQDFEDKLIKMSEDQEKYDKKLKKILKGDQMDTFVESVKPHFASQWMLSEFILNGNQQAN